MISSSRASEKKRSLYCYLPVGKSAIQCIKRLRRVSYLGGFGRQWWHFRSSSQLAVLVSEGPPFCRGPLECGRNHLVEKGRSHTRDRGRKRLNLSRGLPNRREVYAKEEQEGRRGGGDIFNTWPRCCRFQKKTVLYCPYGYIYAADVRNVSLRMAGAVKPLGLWSYENGRHLVN